jgi:short-subunit dehydrogenase
LKRQPFRDQVALVTGASSGIGKETALALARQGAHLVLASRRRTLLEQAARQIEALGRQALVIPTDICQQEQVVNMVAATIQRFGRVDILVANAGEYIRAPIQTLTIEQLERSLAINYYGGIYTILAVLPHMQAQGSGHIVVVTSMDAKKGLPQDAPYVSAKFALTGFTEVLRQELHGSGIFVSNILPGRVDTAMIDDLQVPLISAKIPPQAVSKAIINAILKRQPEVIVPFQARLLHYANALSPRLGDWIARSFHLDGWTD